jgi:hypothetical protein
MSDNLLEDERKAARLAAEARAQGVEPWAGEMARAVPTDLVRALVSDARRPGPSSIIPETPREPVQRGSGWVEAQPLRPPPGQDAIARLCDHAAAQDRLSALTGLAKLAEQFATLNKLLAGRLGKPSE